MYHGHSVWDEEKERHSNSAGYHGQDKGAEYKQGEKYEGNALYSMHEAEEKKKEKKSSFEKEENKAPVKEEQEETKKSAEERHAEPESQKKFRTIEDAIQEAIQEVSK